MNDGDITTGRQIDNYLRSKFSPNVYKGIIINDNIPHLFPDNSFVINNKDRHWTTIYKKNNELLEFDSYGRNMLPSIKDTQVKPSDRQRADDQDCGQRTIAKLLMIFNEFIKT